MFPLSVFCQIEKPIRRVEFQNNLSWAQIKAKAQSSNKFILVDCYATWCVPCKYMDNQVFEKSFVAEFINKHYLSVKIQADTSKSDNEQIKQWYIDASKIIKENIVTALPTFLIFAPNGEIVNRYSGAMNDSTFVAFANNSLNPDKQYYTWVKQFRLNKSVSNFAKSATKTSRELGKNKLADSIAKYYLHSYLNGQTSTIILQPKEVEFILLNRKIIKTTDPVFKIILNNCEVVNKIMASEKACDAFITNRISEEFINPYLVDSINKNRIKWNKIQRKISNQFNSTWAEKSILNEKLKWYTTKKNWEKVIECQIQLVDINGLDTAETGKYLTNNMIYNTFFKHSKSQKHLLKALEWMKVIINSVPNDAECIDTYANLLYKTGQTSEAISWEKKALSIEKSLAYSENREANKYFEETVSRMENNIPTWID